MPSAKSLISGIDNDNFVYLFLSTDVKEVSWKNTMERYGLNNFGLHFRIENISYTSKMNELKITSLPRYMIYDFNGNLVNDNAFRPSNILVKKEIAHLLEKIK